MTDQDAKTETFDPKRYWEDRLTRVSGLHGVGYLGLGQQFNHWLYRVRARVLDRLVRSLRLDLGNMDVLDVGSGTGFYIEQWRKLGVRSIAGCDLTDASINNLQERFPEQKFFRLDIGGDLPPLRQTYDVVSVFDVLYHIVDDERYSKAISNVHQLLRPRGWLFYADYFLHAASPQRATHMVNRTLALVEQVLRHAGFQTVRRVPMFVLMNKPFDTNSVLLPFWWERITTLVGRGEGWGWAVGATLYPVELVLTAVLHESPTTEIVVCRKEDPYPEDT